MIKSNVETATDASNAIFLIFVLIPCKLPRATSLLTKKVITCAQAIAGKKANRSISFTTEKVAIPAPSNGFIIRSNQI